jgi:uncharacterized caspase-like protein
VQKDRVPYLVPTDAEIAVEGDLALDTVPSPSLLGLLEADDRATIALLDACRNNPFADAGTGRSLAAGTGWAR